MSGNVTVHVQRSGYAAMTDRNVKEVTGGQQSRSAYRAGDRSQSSNPLIAILIAVLLAAATGLLVFRYQSAAPPWLLGVAAVLAFCGLFALLGWIGGVVHFGRTSKQITFLEGVLNGLGDPAVVTDLRGRVVFANGRYVALSSGAERSRMAGVENLFAGYPEVAGRIYRLAQAAKQGTASKEDFRLEAGSAAPGARIDSPSWHTIFVEPVLQNGKQTHTLWRLTDNTDARIEQETAFEKLQYIIRYLDEAPAGFFSADAQGSVRYMNATLATWLGLDLIEATSGSVQVSQFTPKESAKLLGRVNATPGETFTDMFDLNMVSRDGTSLPVRVLHSVQFAEDGKPGPSRSLVLREDLSRGGTVGSGPADQRLARFFNNAPIGIAEVDDAGRIVNSNTTLATMAGPIARETEIVALVDDAHRQAVSDAIAAARDGKRVAPIEVQLGGDEAGKGTSGQLFVSRMEESGEDAASVILYMIDTTEHKALELKFAQSQKMQAVGQLAGGVAHDFNNMLTAIIGFSDLLLSKHRPTDPSFQDIMNIKQNANRAANLVRQLLAFSRRQTLRPEILSLTDTLSDLGNLLNRLLGEKVELEITHGRDLGLVKADVNQFEQVVMNLAVNARDAMPEGGKLSIRTSNVSESQSREVEPNLMPAGEYVLCEVKDTGVGMPEDVLEKIYEPFFSTKEVGKGTGLGLATVYGIVKQTGGFIFCNSEVGEGTAFQIYLPRHHVTPEEAAEAREDERKEVKPADLTGEGTILLVEDEDAVRAFASRALEARGYNVLEADSGVAALKVIDEHGGDQIDLVISDVVMPEMDGPSLLREIRKREIKSNIIFISGYAEDAFAKNLDDNERFSFLPKPFSLKQLAGAVKDAMKS
ncbi:MAG: response regulator [Pseudomonadota bacterium]